MIRALVILIALGVSVWVGDAAATLVCQARDCAALGADVCAERAGR